MGRRAYFTREEFIDAALELIAVNGPAAVTMSDLAHHINAPIGSVYHRFDSREVLFAEAWITLVESFQKGFLEILERDGLEAALYTAQWVRSHEKVRRVLLYYKCEDLISGDWPDEMKERALQLARAFNEGIRDFTKRFFGRVTTKTRQRAQFALINAPVAAVRQYLNAEEIPPLVDELIRETYRAVLGKEKGNGSSLQTKDNPPV